MGFGHRVYRAEDPRSRILKRTAQGARLAAASRSPRSSRQAALAALQERQPERVLATNVEYYSAVVLDVAEIPPPLAPAMFACSRVAGWSAHILEQKRTGRLFRPVGAVRRPGAALAVDARLTLAEAAAQADALAEAGDERELADAAAQWDDELEAPRAIAGLPRARGRLPRDRPVPLPPEDRAAAARARGREPGLPRLGAHLARAALARPSRARQRRARRCCTRSRTRTTTRPCGGSRSSA